MRSPLQPSPGQAHQESLLMRSQGQWQQGDWERLSQLNQSALEQDPDRNQLALLVVAAHHQLGNSNETLSWARQALRWGCDSTALARILIAGVHNTLGRCSALLGDQPRMHRHFQDAVTGSISPHLASHDRTVRELSRLGLLQEATKLVHQQITNLQNHATPDNGLDVHVMILKTELSLLQYELALAQRRGQLQGRTEPNQSPATSLEEANSQWLAELSNRTTSQIGQDMWVLEKTSYKRGGYFVEFGATNGILLSNTYLLEKEFAWRGLCAEPNPSSFLELKENRLCTVSNACIGAITGEQVEFIFAEAYGGMARDADNDNHKGKREAYRNAGDTAILTTISLHDFLTEHNSPKIIDYISIDTEGSEFSILETFPFEQWDIRLMTIEHNFTEKRPKIRRLLEARGYLCQEAEYDDWYYKPDR